MTPNCGEIAYLSTPRTLPSILGAEVLIRIALMNRFNALGTAEIERVA